MKLRTFFIYSVCLLLAACSPSKRLQVLLKKHPELLKSCVDTFYTEPTIKKIPVYVPGDTVRIPNRDTVINTKYKYIYINKDSVVVIHKPKYIYIHDTVRSMKYIVKTNNFNTEQNHKEPWYMNFILYIIVGFFMLFIIHKIFK